MCWVPEGSLYVRFQALCPGFGHQTYFNKGIAITRTWRKLANTKHPYTRFGIISIAKQIMVNLSLHITGNFKKKKKRMSHITHINACTNHPQKHEVTNFQKRDCMLGAV